MNMEGVTIRAPSTYERNRQRLRGVVDRLNAMNALQEIVLRAGVVATIGAPTGGFEARIVNSKTDGGSHLELTLEIIEGSGAGNN